MNIADFKAQNPDYQNVPDGELADALYRKFYADKMGRDEFMAKIGMKQTAPVEKLEEPDDTGAVAFLEQTEPGGSYNPITSPLSRKARAVGLAMKAAQGPTLGFADEISGAMAAGAGGIGALARGESPEFGKRYEAQKNVWRSAEAAFDKAHPVAGTAMEIATSVPGGMGAGAKMAQLLPKLPPWLQATGLGALLGGVSGAGHSEGTDRITDTAIGAPLGAVTGAAVHGGARLVGKTADVTKDLVRRAFKPEAEAIERIAKELSLDEKTATQVYAKLKMLGKEGMILDAGGRNIQKLARETAGVPGPAQNKILNALQERDLGEAGRIKQATKLGLRPDDYFAAEETMLAKLKDNAANLYQDAYKANPSVMTPRLERLLRDPDVIDGVQTAARMAARERASGISKWLAPVDEELTQLAREAGIKGKIGRGFSLETWQHVKEGIDALLKSKKYTNELTGKLTPEGRSVEILRQSLVNELDKATGGEKSLYALARKQYAGDAEVLSALREGKEFLAKKLAPEQIAKRMGELSDAAKESYRSGAARAIMDIVAKTPDQQSAANKLFAASATRDKIRAIFPDQKSANEFSRRIIAEQRFAESKRGVGQGARTISTDEEKSIAQRVLGSIGAVIGSKTPGVTSLVAAGVGRQAGRAIAPGEQKIQAAIAKILTTRNPAEKLFYLEQLRGGRPQQPPTLDPWTAAMIMGLSGQEGRGIGGR